jgi:regulatory protein
MRRPKDLSYAKWLAQYYLSFRMHSRAELFLKLQKKEVPTPFIMEALKWCEEQGYINDLDFAKRYIKDAVNLKKRGKSRIIQELYVKKIKKEIIDDAFSEIENELDFDKALSHSFEIKAKTLDLNERKGRDKLIAHLARKGFGIGDILKQIEKY